MGVQMLRGHPYELGESRCLQSVNMHATREIEKPGKIFREPPDCTWNEPTLDIPIGGSGQDIKKQNGKYMPFVRTC